MHGAGEDIVELPYDVGGTGLGLGLLRFLDVFLQLGELFAGLIAVGENDRTETKSGVARHVNSRRASEATLIVAREIRMWFRIRAACHTPL